MALFDAGIINQNVDAAGTLDRRADQCVRTGFLADVRTNQLAAASVASNRRANLLGVAAFRFARIVDEHAGAGLREPSGDGAADSCRCAGNDCGPAAKIDMEVVVVNGGLDVSRHGYNPFHDALDVWSKRSYDNAMELRTRR